MKNFNLKKIVSLIIGIPMGIFIVFLISGMLLNNSYEALVKENKAMLEEIAYLESEIIRKEQEELERQRLAAEEVERQRLEEARQAQIAQQQASSNSSSNSTATSQTTNNTSSGTMVYVRNENNYYHKTSSCKFIRGQAAQYVDLSNYLNKYKCNCWYY